jgi:hypothetical protein
LGRAIPALPAEGFDRIEHIMPAARAADAIGPAAGHKVCLASGIVGKGFFPLPDGHLMDAFFAWFPHGLGFLLYSQKEYRLSEGFCQVPDNRPN